MAYSRRRKPHRLKRKRSIIKRPFFWFLILFLVLAIGIFYILVFWEKFQVAEIKISGNQKVSTKDIENIVLSNITKKIFSFGKIEIVSKSIFLVNQKQIAQEIENRFAQVETARIKRKFPQSLILEIIERRPFAVFCGNIAEKCFFIDKNGVIFESVETAPESFIIIRQSPEKELFLGQKIIDKNVIEGISEINKNLNENFQIDVKEAAISLPEKLEIKTSENWQIYFNLEFDIDLQVTKLELLLKQEIPPENRKNLEYIDLRFKDRAYYK